MEETLRVLYFHGSVCSLLAGGLLSSCNYLPEQFLAQARDHVSFTLG